MKNEFQELILTRRSVRSFTNETVDQDEIHAMLEAAMHAPSASNQQPWQFVVIDRREILNEVPKFHPYAQMLLEAPLGILVCGDMSLEKNVGFWVQDCSAAAQNLLLSAHALGLGAVWLSSYPREERVAGFKKLLSLPENIIPLAMVAIGHPKVAPKKEDRFNKSRIHLNKW